MRKEALVRGAFIASLFAAGCGLMPGGRNYPGIVEPNPYAVNQTYAVPAFRVARAMQDVLINDPFYTDVKLMAEPASRGSRPLSREQRAALGPNAPSRDVNFSLTAKTINNHRVAAVVQLKGEAGSEASVLFDSSGDPDMSRSVLEAVGARLAGAPAGAPAPSTAPATAPTEGSGPPAMPSIPR